MGITAISSNAYWLTNQTRNTEKQAVSMETATTQGMTTSTRSSATTLSARNDSAGQNVPGQTRDATTATLLAAQEAGTPVAATYYVESTPWEVPQDIPITQGQILPQPPLLQAPEGFSIPKLPPEITEAERAARIAEQQAVKVHTTYEVGGQVAVVLLGEGGGLYSPFNTTLNQGTIQNIWQEVSSLGLTGDAQKDYIAEKIGEALKQQYGSVNITKYAKSTAPTIGEVQSTLQNNLQQGVKIDSKTLTALLER